MVDAYSPYTAIVAKPWLHTLGAVFSTLHQKVKYLSEGQVKEILGSQSTARLCLVAANLHQLEDESLASTEKGLQQSKTLVLLINEPVEEAKCEDLEKVVIGDDSEKFFQIEAQIPPQEKEELKEFLKRNVDVFTQNAYEASGVNPNFICHHLNVNPSVALKKQLPRR